MLRTLLILCTLMFCLTANAQPPANCTCTKAKDSESYYNCSDKEGRKQGYWKTFAKNGTIIAEDNYRDNKRHGASKIYYRNGAVKEQAEYRLSHIVELKTYRRNGNLKLHVDHIPAGTTDFQP